MSKRAREEGSPDRRVAFTPGEGMARYEVGRLLGEGAFAAVRLATDKKTGIEFAMKLIDTSRSSADAVKREVEVLTAVGVHANVTSLIDYFADPARHEWVLIIELAQGGEVFEHIVRDGHYSEADAAVVLRDVAHALVHLHARAICHRDIKPENLLITSTRPPPGSRPRASPCALLCLHCAALYAHSRRSLGLLQAGRAGQARRLRAGVLLRRRAGADARGGGHDQLHRAGDHPRR
jgi:serine/threonine protein kinase